MSYQANTFVAGEVPSSSKWQQLWDNDASMHNGTGLPSGTCVQIVDSLTSAVSTGTGIIPLDDTIPQNTEGDQVLSVSITPRSATNKLVIESTVWGSTSANQNIIIALFQDSTANALAATDHYAAGTGLPTLANLYYSMTAGTTSSTTFKIRAGTGLAVTTLTINGIAGARYFSTTPKSSIVVREYTV